MINKLQNYLQQSTKVFALVLLVLCGQLLLNSHAHSDDNLGVEACTVCLVGQVAEFDDALVSTATVDVYFSTYSTALSKAANQQHFDNSPLSLYLRGPPA